MCEFFVKADPIHYESRTRSVRIHGVHTSIRLENFVWDTLATLAAEEGMTTNALMVQFHDEIMLHRGDVQNFTSFLRVTCLRYLRRKCDRLESAQENQDLPEPAQPASNATAPTATTH
ncbi:MULTISPECIES: ribbon-helix-helix domain-containing protein [Cupriavidus]